MFYKGDFSVPHSAVLQQQHALKVLSAGLKTYDVPPDYSGKTSIHITTMTGFLPALELGYLL